MTNIEDQNGCTINKTELINCKRPALDKNLHDQRLLHAVMWFTSCAQFDINSLKEIKGMPK